MGDDVLIGHNCVITTLNHVDYPQKEQICSLTRYILKNRCGLGQM